MIRIESRKDLQQIIHFTGILKETIQRIYAAIEQLKKNNPEETIIFVLEKAGDMEMLSESEICQQNKPPEFVSDILCENGKKYYLALIVVDTMKRIILFIPEEVVPVRMKNIFI